MHAIYVISIILISIGITLFLLSFIFEYTRKQNLKKRTIDEYAIIIPARNESKVIKNLLDSIKLQNPNMDNVYVIVEDKKDETVKIVKEYGGNIYVRKNIENRRRKQMYQKIFIFLENTWKLLLKILGYWHRSMKGFDFYVIL